MSLRSRFSPVASFVVSVVLVLCVILMTLAGLSAYSPRSSGKTEQTPSVDLPLDSTILINEIMPLTKQGDFQWVELLNNNASIFLPLITAPGGAEEVAVSASAREPPTALVGNLAGWQIADRDG